MRFFASLWPARSLAEGRPALGAGAVFSRPQRLLLLAAFALIVILRLPAAWAHGRFQAEEGTVFLAYAWHFPWTDALFRPFGGYLNLGANAPAVLTVQLVRIGILPLERAPYLTMGIALAFQLLPAVLILTGKAQWLASRLAVTAALLILAIAPATEEVFFNTLHIQFHLALCTALILAFNVPAGRAARIGYGALLFLAPLCGPAAIVMLPLFALRALIDRDPRRLMQLAPLAAGAAVQLMLFYEPSPVRGNVLDPASIAAAMFVRLIATPILGIGFANRIANVIHASQVAGGTQWWAFAAATTTLFGLLIVVAAQRRDAAIWLVLSALSIAAISLGVGMIVVYPADLLTVVFGERYNFLPAVLLGLALVALAMRPEFSGRPIFALLCTLVLISGALYYRRPLPIFAGGPSWPAEVVAWHRDHHHPLALWPRPWTADLSNETRPCSPPGRDLAQSTDPRYCESGWIAGFYPR
jgi:hypothetical protein